MGIFEHFPYTNFHELNAAWLLKKMKELDEAMETFKATESLKFADPIIWNITTQYQKSTIVLDPTGNAYLSLQPVPTGVQLNNDEYWLEIFNFTDYTRTANENLTVNTETNTTRATSNYQVDDWLIWNDVLYKVTVAIAVDDLLEVGTNLVHFTVEDFLKAFITYATGLIQQYKNDIDASELAYKNEIDASETAFTNYLQNQFNQVLAGATVDSEVINGRLGADNENYTTIGVAIRTQIEDAQNYQRTIDSILSDAFDCQINIISYFPYVTGKYWGHNALTQSLNANSRLYRPIPIKAGRTIYLYNVYGYFCNIQYEDGTFDEITTSTGNSYNGSITPTKDGWLYITIQSNYYNTAIVTFSAELYNHPGSLTSPPTFKLNGIKIPEIDKLFNITWETDDKLHNVFIFPDNLIDTSLVTNGYYYGHGNLTLSVSSTANILPPIRIYKGVKYYYHNIYAYFTNAVYENGTIVPLSNTTGDRENGSFTAADNGYLYVTIHNLGLSVAALSQNRKVAESGGQSVSEVNTDITVNTDRVITVGTNGDFSSLVEAVNYAAQFKNITIFVKNGTYNIENEIDAYYGAGYLDNVASGSGLGLSDITIIGSPRAYIKFDYTGSNDYVKRNFSIFNILSGRVVLKGLNLSGSNIRYLIHDEHGGDPTFVNFTIERCYFDFDNSNNTVFPASQCVGGGLSQNELVTIKDSFFKTVTTSWGSCAVSYHNSIGGDAESYLVIKDNYFDGNSHLRIRYHGTTTYITECLVSNNSFGDVIHTGPEQPEDSTNNIRIIEWNNVIRS